MVFTRRTLTTLLAVTSSGRGLTLGPRAMRIDAHLHLWSADGSDWAAGAVPPTALAVAATTADFVVSARAAGMDGAVVVHHNFPWTKPDSTFGFDHAYVLAALRAHPSFLRGMAVVDPRQGAAAGCAALEALREAGFGAVRLNEALFAELEGGIGGPVAQALYRKAGELGMPVSARSASAGARENARARTRLCGSPRSRGRGRACLGWR
jgi:predicted TIM-barrel fold metal-dependent hydrolase